MSTAETSRAGKPGAIRRRAGGFPRPSVPSSRWIYPGLVILASLLAILPGILESERACEPDSARYLGLGQRLFAQGCYCNDDGSPHATTPPVYPIIAAPATIGMPDTGATTLPAARAIVLLLQALIFIASVDLLRRLCHGCGMSASASRSVALLYGLSPLPLIYVGRVLSETVFVALLLGGLYLFLVPSARPARGRAGWLRPTLAGSLLGLAALTRILLAPWFLLWPLLALGLPRWRRQLLFASLGVILVLGPWMARNWSAFGRPGLSAAGGTNALEYAAALIAPLEEREAELRAVRGPQPLSSALAEADAQALAAGRIIVRSPGTFLIAAVRYFPAVLAPPVTELLRGAGSFRGTAHTLRERGPAAALGEVVARVRSAPLEASLLAVGLALWDLVILAAALVGLALIATRRRPPDDKIASIPWLLLGSLVLVLLVTPVGAWHPRFRVPLAPAVALCAYVFAARVFPLHRSDPDRENVPCD